ncbi:hypothetical protein GSI_00333 [Ganoderma sinense ZZ0214-1]|uniref:Cyclin N-terminal domain-containing protein n=1 Tax=Ganoderma sinense ZZ0214-1 TaxID=1077348 RepID=A0A2G8SSB6_9APHY|nr:hypothetical protein GSI_00333 [Ganoderma sinense ZZ0214-1]
MGFSSTTTFAPSSVAAILASLFSDTASPQTMNEPTSLVPVGVLDPKVMNMVNFPMNLGVIEFFIDVLVAAVARAVIASRYKAAPPMKTPLLMRCIIEYIVRGLLDTRTILTAVVYLSDIRLTAYDMGDFVCERLAIGALMLAHKANNEPSYPGSQWFQLAQVAFGSSGLHLTRKGLNKIEREFLACLDWQVMPTTEKLLDHHDVFMRYARRDLEVYSVTQAQAQAQMVTTRTRPIPVPERAEPTYPRATLSVAAADLPDLMYPDTPSLSDGYSSDSSAGIITPPSSGHAYAASGSHTGRVGPTRKGRSPPCPYSRPPRRMSSHRTPGYGQNDPRSTITITSSTAVDSAMEARIRFYAADRGTVLRECGGSPRYVPYSPSQRWLHRRDRYDSAPTPSPSSAIAAELAAWNASLGFNSSSKREFAAPPTSTYPPYRRAEDPFCRRYQSWSSTMPGVAANDKWGTFGLFRQ